MRSKDEDGLTFTERARRTQIVECAIEVIAERGFSQASVSRIAERVGVAKSVVLYHFASKDELVGAILTEIYLACARVMVPALDAESTAAGRLRAYIRSNIAFIESHPSHILAQLDMWTSYRTASGLRLDEAAAQARPEGDLVKLNPLPIFEFGMRTGEFRELSAPAMAIALRQSIDGAVLQISRDPEFDVRAYGEELVTLFDRATRRAP